MTKKEALTVVRESAEFWRAEEIRTRGEFIALIDTDTVTCADPELGAALAVLGESEFLKEFNDVYGRVRLIVSLDDLNDEIYAQVRRGYR